MYEPLVEVEIKPLEIDEPQPIAEVKIEPEFIDFGRNLCEMDVEYEPPVVVKTEPLDFYDSKQPAATSSSTELIDQQQMETSKSDGTSKKLVSLVEGNLSRGNFIFFLQRMMSKSVHGII